MISCADQNNKWASYAGPGGWNGKHPNNILFLYDPYLLYIILMNLKITISVIWYIYRS